MAEMKMMTTLTRALSQNRLTFAFLVGFFLVLLTYFTMSEQFAIRSPTTVILQSSPPHVAQTSPVHPGDVEPRSDPVRNEDTIKVEEITPPLQSRDERKADDPKEQVELHETQEDSTPFKQLEQAPQSKPICDTDDPRSDICDMVGDVRTHGASSTVLFVPPANPTSNAEAIEWKIRGYSRKHMTSIKEITVKQLHGPQEAPPCSIKHNVPALVFTLGGFIGNYWHDFSDVIIPLFVASQRFDGEVQFLITNIQGWWIGKYQNIIKMLTHYEVVDFDKDNQIRCFSHALVGLRSHKEFSIDPSRVFNGSSMVDFRSFMRIAYSLDRNFPISLKESPGRKPRLMLIARGHNRKFTNVPEIVQSAEKLGFEVVVMDAKFHVNIAEYAKTVNSFDVMMGVHGAGLTNCVFLPTNAVMIQVVPYGNLEGMAKADFGEPAIDMKLKYLEYSITAEESTLMDMLGKDHPVIKDPISIHKSGWQKVAEFYLGKQNVRLDVNRFEPVLKKALDLLSE
ncbi:beta-1,2-xylosyltransferase XYXT1-like [Typha angustifolia]|uniref:beta-1,2-xylosyltransferase XYXT1-like n=1 Tax=Typha angustifolia TaxID=59011 RepID=UPI003C2FF708